MCGISGFISKNGASLKIIEKMNHLISHRGPDDEGFVAFQNKSKKPVCLSGNNTTKDSFEAKIQYKPTYHINDINDDQNFNIALGHRRLSILDLSNFGHQPMCSHDGRIWITYNGEIYNYKELRDELITSGYKFFTSTDTEVILNSYLKWGSKCLQKFNGMWAFAIYDVDNQELFMSRDRFGIKPLYYWIAPSGTMYFGSEIKQFIASDEWSAVLNGQRAYDYLVYSLTDHTEETMFTGVFHIPPGYYFKSKIKEINFSNNSKIKFTKWYSINKKKCNYNFFDASNEFEKKFKDAVKLHLRSDVPVGSALSGGLDSSSIVCEIKNLLKDEGRDGYQKTFSSCDTDKRFDERKWIDIVIEHTNVEPHFVYPDFKDVFKLTSKIIWHQDEPYQSQSAFLGYLVFQLAKKNNIKVLLNGQGADEYLGGYGQLKTIYYLQLLKKGSIKKFIKEVKNAGDISYFGGLKNVSYLMLPNFLKKVLTKRMGSTNHVRNLVSLEKLQADEIHPFYNTKFNKRSVIENLKFYMFFSPLPRYLRWEDRNSMAHSIEARVPFLDYRLVEYCANQPVENLYSNDTTKLILRSGLKDILPEKIKNRQDKMGFITPEERWVKENYTSEIREQLEYAIHNTQDIIKPEALEYFDKVTKGEIHFDYTYWRLILFSKWMKCFDVNVKTI